MTHKFNRIGIVGKPTSRRAAKTVDRIAEFLCLQSIEVMVHCELNLCKSCDGKSYELQEIGEQSDLIIVVGGDGTLLGVARALLGLEKPIIGVNRGRLGFLVDVSPEDMFEIDEILSGNYMPDTRMLLDVKVMKGDEVISSSHALNDAVLYKWNTPRMIEFDIHIDGKLLNSHRSDGLIISTPTGSTAYALSSGGPIIHPEMESFLLVPICPHTLSNRPFMIGSESTIEITLKDDCVSHSRISCDGQQDLILDEGVKIVITKAEKKLHLLHPCHHDFFEILRAKLRWGDPSLS
ncbi:MAG: NAD(+) kinase [Gammaproteobacteria bacterium]|nr:MAG: NAD(+) kinase [Gammaproteobacteria bacterium]